MSDNTGNPATPDQWSQTTTYTYLAGQLTSTTDANDKTVSYLYNDAGEVACEAYPVGGSSSCGTLAAPAVASATNTIVTSSYDQAGRLTSTSDWLGNTVNYAYNDPSYPNSITQITYPTSTGLSANYTYDNDGNLVSLNAGPSIDDAWTYNGDEQVATTTINGATSAAVNYNGNGQITAATNLATSTGNDVYGVAANGEITSDQSPSGTTVTSAYNAGDELCNEASIPTSCGSTPTNGTSYQYTTNGERASATPYDGGSAGASTYYAWNAYGQLCNVASSVTACGSMPASGVSYQYNGEGLRTVATTPTSTTDTTWDTVSGGSMPLNINDATTTSGVTTNTSYVYGDLAFGGVAPVEQITTTSSGATPVFLVSTPAGVQGVYSASGSNLELAIYSLYGNQSIISGTDVTPFGFEGSYTDSTGLLYLINRYYDSATGQFLSVDPDVATTNEPYVFTNDDPSNREDPLGLSDLGWGFSPAYIGGGGLGAEGGGEVAGASAGIVFSEDVEDTWGNPSTLDKHFVDHGSDFDATSPDEYAAKANKLYKEAKAGDPGVETKEGPGGVLKVYDPQTNTFGSYNADGTTRTFFKPTSPTYWSRQ